MEEDIFNETRNFLIQKKEDLNGDIESIIYDFMETDLSINELKEINKIRKKITYIYGIIERIDKYEKVEQEDNLF